MAIEDAPKINNPKDKIEEIKKKRAILYKSFSREELNKFQEELVKYIKENIRIKYPNYANYVVYHILVGSTVLDDVELIEEDFPGDDSVEKFLEKCSEKSK